MLETSALLVFVRIVDGRSLAAAARALGMPRATVSRKLALLEEELGVRLLRRTTRSLSLTDAGRDLLRHARTVVDAALAAARSVARREDDVRGDVRLSIGPHVANALADVIASFVAAHPSVRLFVQVTHRTVDLRRDPIDVAIRASKALSAGLVARRLARASLVAVASPRYLAEHGEPRTLRDLAVHRCLMGLDDALSPRTSFPSSTGRAVAARGVFFSDDPPLLLEGCLRGLGIALLPSRLVDEHLARRELLVVLPGKLRVDGAISIVYAERERMAPELRAFVDWVVARAPAALEGGRSRART